ncbi:MAG TPA: TRAP transporter small permease [Casimicrobiaceae bacterium]|nr:TRAP transporter small permease [Casimicrobiaceae bacterium]
MNPPTRDTAFDRFARGVRALSTLCGFVAAGLVALAVVIVCEMVFVRYVLNRSTIWQTDFITYCITAATFIGSPYVLLTRGHVNVNVLPLHLSPRRRYVLALFASIVSAAFCAVMTVMTFLFWKEAWDNRWVSDTMWRARLWIPYSSMPIGLGLLTLQYVVDIVRLVTRRDPPFDIPIGDDAAAVQAAAARAEIAE